MPLPQFLLHPCAVPAVATVHDLSIIRYPQFDPSERVAFMQKKILWRSVVRSSSFQTSSLFGRGSSSVLVGREVARVAIGVYQGVSTARGRGSRFFLNKLGLAFVAKHSA